MLKGIVKECLNSSCALISGETAELPGVYIPDEYDLVGCIVGIVEKDKIIYGRDIEVRDTLIGLASSGLHTNGYSLVRKVLLELKKYALDAKVDALDCPLIEEIMKPHKNYLKVIKALRDAIQVKGMAHITGGGMPGNIPRILPENVGAIINEGTWEVPPIFSLVQRDGGIATTEMY